MAVDAARAQTIFSEALEQPPAQRAEILDRACAGDQALRERVERLLAAHESAGSFMVQPPPEPTANFFIPIQEAPGTKIGHYKLLQQIGEGGFGVVFMAEQEFPVRRRVALKIIKLGMDTRQVVARFEAERQALAMMDHPAIAKVLDGGATETGRPYFVMELVKGERITEYCDKNRLTIPQRLELMMQVCQAVQHAHQKGLIHRDLKPSNILVCTQDDRPVVKVIDFGIAKAMQARLTEKTMFTDFQQMIGTPEYMSPEQADGDLDLDTRTDVYSLGVLLYELLAGTPPFEAKELRSKAFAEMQRIIREVEPPAPSTRLSSHADMLPSVAAQRGVEPRKLQTLVRGELDWIVMKCLEKNRRRRYQTANGLGRDIERYLHDEAVEACPPSAAYRVRKFVARHRRPVTAAIAFVLLLLAATATSAWLYARAESQRRLADSRERIAQEARAEAEIARTAAENSRNQAEIAQRQAESERKAAELARHDTEIELQRARLLQVQLELATGDMAKARSLLLVPIDPSLEEEWHWRAWEYARKSRIVNRVDLTPAGEVLAPASLGGKGRLTLTDGRLIADVSLHRHKALHVELDARQNQATAPFGEAAARTPVRYAAVCASDGTVEIREDEKPAVVDSFPGTGEDVVSFAFDPGGRQLYGITGDWYVVTWLWSPGGCVDVDITDTQTEQARLLRFTPDGRRLVSVSYGDVVAVWDAATHERVQVIHPGAHPVGGNHGDAQLTSDGQTLFTTAWDEPVIRVWRVSDGSLLREIKCDPTTGRANAIRLLLKSDGKSLYTVNADDARARFQVLDAQDGTKIASYTLPTDGGVVYAFVLSEKYNRLFAALMDNPEHQRCAILDATTLQTAETLPDAHTGGMRDIHLSPDGNLLALCSRDGTATLWDWQHQRLLHRLEAKPGRANSNVITCVRFHPTAPVVATSCHDNHVIFWSTGTGRPLADLNINEQSKLGYGSETVVAELAFSPDGKTLVITVKDKLWWLDLSCYDQAIANLKAERDKPRSALPSGVPRARVSGSAQQAALCMDRGKVHNDAGRSQEAIAEFTRAIEIEPEYARPWYLRGWVYQRLAQPEKACSDVDKAVTLDPLDYQAWSYREKVYTDQHKYEQVIDSYAHIVELLPDMAWPLIDHARYLFKVGRATEADQDLAAAIPRIDTDLRHWPTDSATLERAARLLATIADAKLRNPGRAVELAEKSAQLEPTAATMWRTLGIAHCRAGQFKDAANDLEKSTQLPLGQTSEAFFFLAMAHHQLGHRDTARQWYEKGIQRMTEAAPRDAELLRLRAETAALLKLPDEITSRPATTSATQSAGRP